MFTSRWSNACTMKMVQDVSRLLDQYLSAGPGRYLAPYPTNIEHPLGPDWYIFCCETKANQRLFTSLDEDLFTAIKPLIFSYLNAEDTELPDTIIANQGAVCWDEAETELAIDALADAAELALQQVGQNSAAPIMASYCHDSLAKVVEFCEDALDADPQWLAYFRG